MTKLAGHAVLVLVLVPARRSPRRLPRRGKFKTKTTSGAVVYQNYVDNCPYNPRPCGLPAQEAAIVKPLAYFKPPAYVLSGQL